MATENVKIVISAFNKTQEAFNKVTSGLKKVSSASARMAKDISVAATAATAAIAGMGYALSQQTQKIDDVAKTARKLGTSVSTLQELQYAAEISGVSTTTLNMAMQRLTRRVSEAASGFGEAKGALRELGLNAAKLEKMPLDQQMAVLADAFQDVESEADKVRLAMKLFDSEGVALVNTLGIGSEGLREMAAEANNLGIVLTDIEAARFEEMNDQITRMKFSASAAATTFTAELMPVIEGIFTGFADAGYGASTFQKAAINAAHGVINAYGFFLDTIHRVKLAFAVLSEFISTGFLGVIIGLKAPLNVIIDMYNRMAAVLSLPLVENPLEDNLLDAYLSAEKARESLAALRAEPLPSDKIKEYLDNYEHAGTRIAEINEGIGESVRKLTFFEQMRALGQREQARLQETQAVEITNAFAKQTSQIAAYSRKAFNLDKGVKIAQALMNTYQGATLALATYPGPVGIALAATTIAAGMANVAQIKAQKFQGSFEGGGFTGMGVRAGGIDGRGGFPAILHPNETVIDHTKGQGEPVSVTVNISAVDTKGFDELLYKRRGQLVSIINQAVNNRGRVSIA